MIDSKAWIVALFLILPLLTASSRGLFSFLHSAELPAKSADAPPAKEPEKTAPPKSPWAPGQEFSYTWLQGRQVDGTTHFRLIDLEKSKDPNPVPAARLQLTATWKLEVEGTSRKKETDYFFDAGGTLLRFQAREHVSTIKNISSNVVTEGWMESGKLMIRSSNNKTKEGTPPFEMDLPKEAFIITPQGVELWALFLAAAAFQKGDPKTDREFALAYPEFGKIYQVKFHLEDEKPLEVPRKESSQEPNKESIPCKHFKFSSSDQQLHGEVWVDQDGRLRRYQQGKLLIQLDSLKKT